MQALRPHPRDLGNQKLHLHRLPSLGDLCVCVNLRPPVDTLAGGLGTLAAVGRGNKWPEVQPAFYAILMNRGLFPEPPTWSVSPLNPAFSPGNKRRLSVEKGGLPRNWAPLKMNSIAQDAFGWHPVTF